jgi:signal transduction histidine kinase
VEDDQDGWWLAADNTLARVMRSALEAVADGRATRVQTRLYTVRDGLPTRFAAPDRQPCAVKTRDGRIWLGTANGLVEIAPRAVRRNPLPPRIVVKGLNYLGADGQPVALPGSPASPYEIAPGGRAVTIAFAVLSYLAPEQVVCATRLEREGQLVTTLRGRDRSVRYELLPPGSYTLQISAANADGVWNDLGATVQFRLLPQFWETTWFLVGSGVVLAGLLGAGVAGANRRRVRALRQRAATLLEERRRLARELHDGSEQMLLATRLHLQLAREQLPGDAPPLANTLGTLEQLTRQLLAETRAVVWDLRHAATSEGPLETQLRARLQSLAAAPGVKPELMVDGLPWAMPPPTARNLCRLALEAVTNALKHARPSQVRLRLHYEPARLTLEILDNGCGFDPAGVAADGGRPGHGLLGMRERAAGLGAELDLQSAPGRGTTVRVILPRPALTPS